MCVHMLCIMLLRYIKFFVAVYRKFRSVAYIMLWYNAVRDFKIYVVLYFLQYIASHCAIWYVVVFFSYCTMLWCVIWYINIVCYGML